MNDYSYLESLNKSSSSKEQWAWEFLRRNPEYQRDYKVFIQRWNELVKDYVDSTSSGIDAISESCEVKNQLPEKKLKLWQSDMRSLAFEGQDEMKLLDDLPVKDGNNPYQETHQIEDWMMAKWGFSSFPLDPSIQSPKIPNQLTWQEQTINLDEILFDAQTPDPITQLNFDLRYSLKDQLEAAHKDLIKLTGQLQRLGKVHLVASDHYPEWLDQLKLLDDEESFEKSDEDQQTKVLDMCHSGYRKILLMRG